MRGRPFQPHRVAATALAAAVAVALVLQPRVLNAEDRVNFRGAYFREASNRVIQPMMELTKDLPQGYDVGGHLLVDAISSASIAQGAMVDERVHRERATRDRSASASPATCSASPASSATATSRTTSRTPGA